MRCLRLTAAAAALAVLAACGGSNDGPACDSASQKASLRSFMADWYLWAGSAPNPDPAPYADLPAYLDALRFGGGAGVPADSFSRITPAATFERALQGRELGYGVFVNSLEGTLPLRVRHVEPRSPAAGVLQRGDTVVSVNGRSAADLVAANDFSALAPAAAGEQVTLVVDRAGTPVTATLTAASHALTPVYAHRTIALADGRIAGYVAVRDFLPQAAAALHEAFEDIRGAGATELIVDLRYTSGGRVSVAATLGALIAAASDNRVFARLRYNAARAGADTTYTLGRTSRAPFTRVVVLTGPRSCSAAELLINGLSPHVQVVTVGATTCGKPVGSNPVEICGQVVSAVTFEVENALGAGRYYGGLAPTCAATEDFTGTPGDPAERLTAAGVGYLNSGACVVQPPAPPRPDVPGSLAP